MESNNLFDKLIREKFEKGNSEVPAQVKSSVRDRLVKEGLLDRNNHSNKWIYLFALLAVSSLSIFAVKLINQNNNPTKYSSENTVAVKDKINQPAPNTSNNIGEINNIDYKEKQTAHPVNSNTKINSTESNLNNYLIIQKIISSDTHKPTFISSENNFRKNVNTGIADNEILNFSDTDSHNVNYNSTPTSEWKFYSNTSKKKSNSYVASLNESLILSDIISVDNIEMPEIKDGFISRNRENTPHKNQSLYTIEIFGGMQWTYMQGMITSSGTGGSDQSMMHSEYSLGGKMNMFKKRLSLGFGIHYSKNESGLETTYDTLIGSTHVKYPAHVSVKYSVLNIPLTVGYISAIRQMELHLEAGFSTSFIKHPDINATVDNLYPEGRQINQISTSEMYYSFVANATVLYPLCSSLKILVQPTYSYGLTSLINKPVDVGVNSVSIRIGLRWRIN